VVPDVCDESGRIVFEVAGKLCFGHVPEVEGVGDECGELEEDETLELVFGECSGAGVGAGGAAGAGGVWAAEGVGGTPRVGPSGWSLGMELQLYWNSGTVRNL
jgi:hypothetical protein